MYSFLDWFFVIFHGALVLFNLTGWAWRRTRRLHLATISLTLLSWFGLGVFFGMGYCPCTDWHWRVKVRLGETDLPNSYILYYLDKITGTAWDPALVDVLVLGSTLLALVLSVGLNGWDYLRAHKRRSAASRPG
jgi:hypothetical protein